MEASAKIRASVDTKRGNRYRGEADARANAEAEIKEKVEKKRKAREATEKAGDDTTERARAWANAKARDKAEISKIAAKAREKVEPEYEVTARAKKKYTSGKIVATEAGAETRVRVEDKAEVSIGMWES